MNTAEDLLQQTGALDTENTGTVINAVQGWMETMASANRLQVIIPKSTTHSDAAKLKAAMTASIITDAAAARRTMRLQARMRR